MVAAVKIAAALFTGSASMAAEGVHSVVDVSNGGLMLYGYRRSRLRPDRRHPLGPGRELSSWSFVVALLFFTLGAGFSIFEGAQRITHLSVIRSPLVIYLVLAADGLFEGASWIVALKGFRAAKGNLGYWQAMKASKDPPGFIVLAEDTAGLAGVAVAGAATFIASQLDVRAPDGVGSVLVGLILALVGWVLVRESKSLLIRRTEGRTCFLDRRCLRGSG